VPTPRETSLNWAGTSGRRDDFATENIGVRGDIRHFHAFQNFEILGFPASDTKLDFARASAALGLRF
jgi:hypothetical protein